MKPTTSDNWRRKIRRAQQVIEEHLPADVPLDELARAVNASSFHFHRVFRGMTGETVREYARRLRLERAAQDLANAPQTNILSIALDAGYDSHEAFSRAFKRHFGMSPSEFRSSRGRAEKLAGGHRMVPPPNLHIERHPERCVAFVRHVGPYDQVGTAWATLMKWGWSKMLFGKPQMFGLCYDDPDVTPPDRLRYDACLVVRRTTKPKGDIQVRTMPETTYAFALHEGALKQVGDTYSRLLAWIAAEKIDGRRWQLGDPPSLERYLADPRKVPPEKMRTEIGMPVVPTPGGAVA